MWVLVFGFSLILDPGVRRILNITWSECVTNFEVRRRTGQPLLSDTVWIRRLKLFGHVARADTSQDHSVLYKPAYRLPQGTGGGVQVVQDIPG